MMIFALPNLPWTPTDHLELFAGQRAVTIGEIEEWAVGKKPHTTTIIVMFGLGSILKYLIY